MVLDNWPETIHNLRDLTAKTKQIANIVSFKIKTCWNAFLLLSWQVQMNFITKVYKFYCLSCQT